MRPRIVALVAGAVCISLVGCGSEETQASRTKARVSLEANPYGERIYEAYRQVGDVSQMVKLPEGSRAVSVTLDCAGAEGHLDVTFTTAGGAGADCSPTASGRAALVALSGDGSLLERDQTMTITGPNDQEWSVAVDAGARVTSNG
jgi:hypothetical protein